MLSPYPHNDRCLASPLALKTGAHLSDGCKVGIAATCLARQFGETCCAKPATYDQLGRPMQQCIGEEPGEFRGSLFEVILSQAPLMPEMQGMREEKVQRLGSDAVGPSGPKRRGSHVEYDIVCSMRRRIAVSKETASVQRTGVNIWQHDYSRGRSSMEELERLSTKCGLVLQVHTKPGELREQPDRPILIQAKPKGLEGATTIPKGSRTKWSEAPGLTKVSDDIVSPA